MAWIERRALGTSTRRLANGTALAILAGVGVITAFVGCGNSDKPPPLGYAGAAGSLTSDASLAGSGGSVGHAGAAGRDSGTDGKAGSGGKGADAGHAGNPVGAPSIAIIQPPPLNSPSGATVLSEAEVNVLCVVKQAPASGSKPVDQSSIELAILDADGNVLDQKRGTPTANANEYAGLFQLTSVPAGRLSFRCSGSDLSESPLTGSASIQTFLDHGPTITPLLPAAGSIQPLKAKVPIDFTVQPTLLADVDPEAAVAGVTFSANGQDITPRLVDGEPGHYKFSVDFTQFMPIPSGAIPLVVTARNSRSPAVETTTTYSFELDGSGPEIAVVRPSTRSVVGGKVVLEFKVTDPLAGVDDKFVRVSVAGIDHPFEATSGAWTKNADAYTYTFDSAEIKDVTAQVTININARDKVGNDADQSTLLLYLDNVPPMLDLDPPKVRELVRASPDYCTDPFDPLGPEAASDKDVVPAAQRFRALVWERTNPAPELFYAGLDMSSVILYLHRDTATPLVVDTNGDHQCDEIPEALRRTVQSHQLTALQPTGTGISGYDTASAPTCSAYGTQTGDPSKALLCTENKSDMARVIAHPYVTGQVPVVFADSPDNGVFCTGISWEIKPWVGREGWVCLAARAQDNVGNVGVSAPLRVCLSDGDPSNGIPDCAKIGTVASANPPSCTDGCTLPPNLGDPPGDLDPSLIVQRH